MPDMSPSPAEEGLSLEDDIGFLISKVAAVDVTETNRRLGPVGLRVRSYAVLALACAGMPRTQKEIAEYLLLDPSQVVTLLDELEREHLLRRIPDPSDRRARLVTATHLGERRFRQARTIAEDAHQATLGVLDESDRRTLLRLLQRVV